MAHTTRRRQRRTCNCRECRPKPRRTSRRTSRRQRKRAPVGNGLFLAAWAGFGAATWGLARLGDPTVDTGALLAVAVSGGAVIAGLVTSLLTNERR